MRDNGSVTGREVHLEAGQVILSRTDTGGKIADANEDFIQISGYSREELIGAPHNILRHRDMPQAVFADLWQTIKKGIPWTGLFKNRTKSGDHYWVMATVSPILKAGQIVGFLSARTKPTETEKSTAESLYRSIAGGTLKGARLEKGILRSTGLLAKLDNFINGTIAARLRTLLTLMTLLLVGLGAIGLQLGYAGYEGAERIFRKGMAPTTTIADISDLMRNNDLPPLKWSSLKYDFGSGGTGNGEEKTYGRRDRREAAAGRCADGAGATGRGGRSIDRRDGSYVLSVAQ